MQVMKVIFLKIGLIRYFVILEDRLRYKDFDFTSPASFLLISKRKLVTCYLILCYYLFLLIFFSLLYAEVHLRISVMLDKISFLLMKSVTFEWLNLILNW